MTITDIALGLPIPRGLLRSAARALQPTRRSSAAGSIGALGLGMVLGAGVALLCAPRSGRELRGQIAGRLGRAGHGRDENETSSHASTGLGV